MTITTIAPKTPSPDTLIGDLVTDDPRRTRTLERLGIDYCCGGRRTIEQAAEDAGLTTDELADALRLTDTPVGPDWAAFTLPELTRHIVEVHHAYLWEEMPRLTALVEKVARVHGERHPELDEVRLTYAGLVADLTSHLSREERVLFPAIEEFFATDEVVDFPFERLAHPISVMLAEHDAAGAMLTRMRDLTGGFVAPTDGCGSYVALLAGLEEMESDLHLHIHKENNVLFPQVIAAEEERLAGSPRLTAQG